MVKSRAMALRCVAFSSACVLALALRPVLAADPPSPMQKTATDLGTPKIGYNTRNNEHTHSMFEFVRSGETVDDWTKLFTVVATRVDADKTQDETKAQIRITHQLLTERHAKVSAFDVRDKAPPVCYFHYVLGGEINVGVIFSPLPGIVTIQQVAAHKEGVITAHDVSVIKSLVGYPS